MFIFFSISSITSISQLKSFHQFFKIISFSERSIVRKRSALQVAPGSIGTIESSPEVSSSQTGTGISPVPSLNSSEIGEVDLDFWDLDINESSSISHSSGKLAFMNKATHTQKTKVQLKAFKQPTPDSRL
uniref:Uncharacterized protein n=1 Tax=Tetranychus urticae TaxID=32264 RepID=T1JU60_TETUR